MSKKIAVLTSGGDAPGMNAAVRAVVKATISYGFEAYVVYNGYKGLVENDIVKVDSKFTHGIIRKGGTILKTARLPEFANVEIQQKAKANLDKLGIDALVGIGGDGTYKGLLALSRLGVKVVGIPGSIDNDISSTDYTIGFMTCLETICNSVDNIKDTMISHNRCAVVEVMGHYCGDLALFSSVACGADYTISNDQVYDEEEMISHLKKMKEEKGYATVIVSEHILNIDNLVKTISEKTGFDTRSTVLGHVQRGGRPCAYDAILATRMGLKAVETLNTDTICSCVVGIRNRNIVTMGIEEALALKREKPEQMLHLVHYIQK